MASSTTSQIVLPPSPRIRKSFRELEIEHAEAIKNHTKKTTELDTLVRAFQGIFALPYDNENSFFVIAGYHGEPFRGAGWSNSTWWGGYCWHGSILFPTWHRAYVHRLENALRSIKGCENVALPFLDWCDDTTRKDGLPPTFNSKSYTFSDTGEEVPNPLYSYTFQQGVFDNVTSDGDYTYTKQRGYETVRFPYSGLVGDKQIEATEKHNAAFPYPKNVPYLNKNVVSWLGQEIQIPGQKQPTPTGTYTKFRKCLNAPNYTLFSNTSSAQQWNQENLNREHPHFSDPDIVVVPLESPHNDMHLCVGGFDVPNQGDFDTVSGANGDMGENDTASFDPIFFFHHCFIDRMFWLWQQVHDQKDELVMQLNLAHYPGTNNVDGQGPTPGMPAGIWINLDTPLAPFLRGQSASDFMTSKDVINIEKQLKYTYGPGSFSDLVKPHGPRLLVPEHEKRDRAFLAIGGLNRGRVRGSFVVSTWATIGGRRQLLGTDAVLSRNHTEGCANCQNHLTVGAYVPLYGLGHAEDYDDANVEVVVHTHEGAPQSFKDAVRKKPIFRHV